MSEGFQRNERKERVKTIEAEYEEFPWSRKERWKKMRRTLLGLAFMIVSLGFLFIMYLIIKMS